MSLRAFEPLRLIACAVACAALAASSHGQIIIDDDFDGAEVSGWIGQGNVVAFSAQNITQADSVITSEVVATAANTNRGIVSETSFEPAATGGFSLSFVVASVSRQPAANGYFIGLVRDNDVFHRDASTRNFGLAFYGQNPRTSSTGGFGLVYGDNNGSGSSDFQLDNSDAQGDVAIDSFLDGFTATISADPTGWSYEITGLVTADGTETVFAGSGSWADAGTDFATLFPAADTWFTMGALQVNVATTHTIGFDRITVVGAAGSGASQFQILSVALDENKADPTTTITWTSRPNRTYSIDFSTDLASWSEIEDGVPSDGDTTEYVHSFLPAFPELVGAPSIYYRIRDGAG